MIQKYTSEINHLAIIGSGTCNLSCKYCFLCGLKNHKTFDNEIIQAVKDGSYLKTFQHVLNRLQVPYYKIYNFTMWGGECTLHSDLWAKHIHEWLDAFPNVRNVSFVSNGMFKIDDVADWYGAINNWALNNNTYIQIMMQISIDGSDEYNKDRGIKSEVIFNNVTGLENTISQRGYNNIKIAFKYKSTLPIDTYNRICETKDSCESYYEWWHKFIRQTLNSFKGWQTDREVLNTPILTSLYDYTQQQGINLTKSLRTQDSLDWEGLRIKYGFNRTLQNDFSLMQGLITSYPAANKLKSTGFCSQYLHEIMVRPDGIMVGCLVGLYNDKDEYRQYALEHDIEEYENCLRVPNRYFLDFYKDSDESIESFYKMFTHFTESYKTLAAANIALIYELAYCGQVDKSYLHDSAKLIRHACVLTGRTQCCYNSLRKTGSPFVSTLGMARLMCNGAFDYIDYITAGKSI